MFTFRTIGKSYYWCRQYIQGKLKQITNTALANIHRKCAWQCYNITLVFSYFQRPHVWVSWFSSSRVRVLILLIAHTCFTNVWAIAWVNAQRDTNIKSEGTCLIMFALYFGYSGSWEAFWTSRERQLGAIFVYALGLETSRKGSSPKIQMWVELFRMSKVSATVGFGKKKFRHMWYLRFWAR